MKINPVLTFLPVSFNAKRRVKRYDNVTPINPIGIGNADYFYLTKNDDKDKNLRIKEIKKDLKYIKNNSYFGDYYKKVFEYFGVNVSLNYDLKTYTISKYGQVANNITFKEIGIDEEKLMENVSYIVGDADFSDSNLKKLKNLVKIGGDAIFEGSQIEDLGNLEEISGSAYFALSKLKTLSNLQKIGKNVDFSDSKIKDLGKLKFIGNEVFFNNSPLKKEDFSKIKHKELYPYI